MRLIVHTETLRAAADRVAENYDSDPYQQGRLDYDDYNNLRSQLNEVYDEVYDMGAATPLVTLSDVAARNVTVSVDSLFDNDGVFDEQLAGVWIVLEDGKSFRTFTPIDRLYGSDITPDGDECPSPTLADQIVGYVEYVVEELGRQLESDAQFWATTQRLTPAS